MADDSHQLPLRLQGFASEYCCRCSHYQRRRCTTVVVVAVISWQHCEWRFCDTSLQTCGEFSLLHDDLNVIASEQNSRLIQKLVGTTNVFFISPSSLQAFPENTVKILFSTSMLISCPCHRYVSL